MPLKLFGITGKKSSGKSSVAKIFRQNNIPVVDIDYLYIDAFQPGKNIHKEILKYFGADYLNADGFINLKKLSVSLCQEKWIKEIIDEMLEQEIFSFIKKLIATFSFHRIDIAGIESGIIKNTKMVEYVPTIIYVDSLLQNRISRMIGKIPKETMRNILNADESGDWDDYDFIIENDETLECLERNTIEVIKELLLFYKNMNSAI